MAVVRNTKSVAASENGRCNTAFINGETMKLLVRNLARSLGEAEVREMFEAGELQETLEAKGIATEAA